MFEFSYKSLVAGTPILLDGSASYNVVTGRNRKASESALESPKYQPQLHIVLHRPEIPPNTGAIGRTCVALQAKLWLIKPLGFEITEKAVRRAGLDYWQHLEWETAENWQDFLDKRQPVSMWMFSRFATKSYLDVSYTLADTLVFGCETAGLPKSITDEHSESLLRIPTHTNVRSINLSSAVAVAGFEATRQIGSPF